ncbi:MAG: ATP-binding protein [Candidatus Limnocylindria bacterium]
MPRRTVRERIDPRLTASLFANYRSATDAVLELVDNAIDSRVTRQTLQVGLDVRPGHLAITVVGGTGMDPARLEREYLRWGASSKQAGARIGRYGQGGKAAIGHLGNRFSIIAGHAGADRVWSFRDDAYRDRTRLRVYELHERKKPVPVELGYVRIEVGAVDKRLEPVRLAARLGEVYRPLLATDRVSMQVNGALVAPPEWPVVETHRISVRAGGRMVRGWYGLLADPPPPGIGPGMRVYHLGRLVGDPDWFGHPGAAQHQALARLIGEVELPHVAVTMNKSDVDHDSSEWMEVESRLHRLLAPIVRRLMREPASEASPQALRTAEQVRRILARALRLLESDRLFESQTAAPLGHELVPRELAETADAKEAAVPDEPGADTPIPPRPVPPGSGPARRGFGEVVIRALDPRIRSAMVVEDGVRRVVVNSRYPLYEVRRGDLWYQLETALREVCLTLPEATVPEFERRVNELITVSVSLTKRRRRPRLRIAAPSLGLEADRDSAGG